LEEEFAGGRAVWVRQYPASFDADTVVTEYGIAELRGRSLSERARQLIAIAHPTFRHALSEAAAKGLV
jgi:acyl-CoA hydrolase